MLKSDSSAPDGLGPSNAEESTTANSVPITPPRSKLWVPLVPFLGFLFLSFLFGAGTMFFRFPMSESITKGFMGVRTWTKKQIEPKLPGNELNRTYPFNIDRPEKTFDGYTLYSGASQTASTLGVSLVDMRRNAVHCWSVSFARIWPNQKQSDGRKVSDSDVCIFACHLYPNGDLLIVFHGLGKGTHGHGLAKLDKESNLLWSYDGNVHHAVTVGEDGTIYTVVQYPLKAPDKSLEFIPPLWQDDYLVVLSPEGKNLREPISILEALRRSQFSELLSPLETLLSPAADKAIVVARPSMMKPDVLHVNSLDVLKRPMALKFPAFKPGQVLLSIQPLDTLTVLDPSTGSIVWGAQGPWSLQHDARFLDNGHLLLFDTAGSQRGPRVLEFDPNAGSFPWSYPDVDDPPFIAKRRGMAQRLPNGNTLIVGSEGTQMIEVTPSNEAVWTFSANIFITTFRRYGPDELLFLKPGQRPCG